MDPIIRRWLESSIKNTQDELTRDYSPKTKQQLRQSLSCLQAALDFGLVDDNFCNMIFTAGMFYGPSGMRSIRRMVDRMDANMQLDVIADRIEGYMVKREISFTAARRIVGAELQIGERQMKRIITKADFEARGKLF